MTETTLVNLILTFRVLLVGGVLLILPRITRKGLLFGAYVGEATADQDVARRLLGGWYAGCAILMALSLLIGLGISLAGRPVAGNLTGTAVLLLGALGLYLRVHFRAQDLAPPAAALQAAQATASLERSEPKGVGLAKFSLALCVPTAIATFAYAMSHYGDMDTRAFVVILFVPSVNLVFSPFIALFALLTTTAKRSLRGGSGGHSVAAQDAFRATMSNVLSWTAILTCLFMALFSVQIFRLVLSENRSLGEWIWWAAGIMLVLLLGNLIRIIKGYGQGGALQESGGIEAPLTNGLADNTHWVWGLFYVDRDDPSIMVEKRFGIGHTLNYGNRKATLIAVTFLVLFLALIALTVFGVTIAGS